MYFTLPSVLFRPLVLLVFSKEEEEESEVV